MAYNEKYNHFHKKTKNKRNQKKKNDRDGEKAKKQDEMSQLQQ